MSSLKVMETLASIYAGQVQEIEDAAQQVLVDVVNLDDAVGAQLDVIGRLVGREREGLDDATYRRRLRTQILINKSSGTGPELIEITAQFLDPATVFEYREDDQYPAAFEIEVTDELDSGLGAQLGLVLRSAKAGGVLGYAIFHQSTPIFAFDGFGGGKFDYDDADTNAGFGISSPVGATCVLDSATTDLTVELALNDIFRISGFTNTADNDGLYRVVGTPTTTTAAVKAIDGREPVAEAAGASVTLETDGYGMRGARG